MTGQRRCKPGFRHALSRDMVDNGPAPEFKKKGWLTIKVALSICIATYNRAAFIGATLDSIIVQATEQVEIVVLDGGSTDNTEEVVRRYRQDFSRLRYFRQKTKMGIDRDFPKAVQLA